MCVFLRLRLRTETAESCIDWCVLPSLAAVIFFDKGGIIMRSTLALFAKSAIIAAGSRQQAAGVGVCDGSNLTFLFQQSKKPTKLTKLNKNFCVSVRVCQQPASAGLEAKRAVLMTRIFCNLKRMRWQESFACPCSAKPAVRLSSRSGGLAGVISNV